MLCRQKYNRAKEMLETKSVAEVALFFNVSGAYIKSMLPAKKKPARRKKKED